MPGEDKRRDETLDEANAGLDAGLKACRVIVDNYRALISGESAPGNDNSSHDRTDHRDPTSSKI